MDEMGRVFFMTGDFERDGKSIIFSGVSRLFQTIIWPDGVNCGRSSFLTSISILENPFLVHGATDSELAGGIFALREKANPYNPILFPIYPTSFTVGRFAQKIALLHRASSEFPCDACNRPCSAPYLKLLMAFIIEKGNA